MAELHRRILAGVPEEGDSVVEFGSGTTSVWRTGTVNQVLNDQAKVQFHVASDGTSWEGYSQIWVYLTNLKKVE